MNTTNTDLEIIEENIRNDMDLRNIVWISSALVLCIISLAFALFANGFVIVVIYKYPQYGSSQYTIIMLYAIMNLGLLLPGVPAQVIPRLFLESRYPSILCRIFSFVQITFFFMQVPVMAYYSLSRYIKFYHPIHYARLLNNKTVYETYAIILTVSAGYCTITEILIGRKYRNHGYNCQLPFYLPNFIIQVILFRIIPYIVIVLVAVKIHTLLRARNRQIAAELNNVRSNNVLRSRSRIRALRKARTDARRTMSAFRLILGLCILFFISQVLPYIIKTIYNVIRGGKNQYFPDKFSFNAVLIQLAELVLGMLYPCFNPVAFIYCDKRLRRSLSQLTTHCSKAKTREQHQPCLGRSRQNRIQPIGENDKQL